MYSRGAYGWVAFWTAFQQERTQQQRTHGVEFCGKKKVMDRCPILNWTVVWI